jgi:transmembrane sensor
MAVISELDRERASGEAAEWLVRLHEDPDDAGLRARFEGWRQADPAHAAAWSEVNETFDLIGQALPAEDPPPVPALTSARRPGRRWWLAAAATAIAACVAFVFLPGLMLRLGADYATSTGEWREVRLTDGSVIDLAPRSAIDVALAADHRDIRLLAGQAFFEVTPDAARPFQVKGQGVTATVLGTGFAMRLGENAAEVAVRHGLVQVDYASTTPPTSRRLEAGDWLSVSWSGQAAAGRNPPDEIGAWRQGQLVAHNRPIADVVEELRPYFGGLIVIANDRVGRRSVTGVYNLREPVEALRAVGRAHADISVTRLLPWLVVISGG